MGAEIEKPDRFSRWITRPQSLIALSAVLLSVCGLFIAVYEASLIRQQQRASVWPHVEVSASMDRGSLSLWVQNTGVGPARVRAVTLSYRGETLSDWGDLLREVRVSPGEVSLYYSLIQGRVLPRDSEVETIFRVTEEDGPAAPELVSLLQREIRAGHVDIDLCYCSVFDECWTVRLQDRVKRLGGVTVPTGEEGVEGCDAAELSGI